jgi:hypothetical protein
LAAAARFKKNIPTQNRERERERERERGIISDFSILLLPSLSLMIYIADHPRAAVKVRFHHPVFATNLMTNSLAKLP